MVKWCDKCPHRLVFKKTKRLRVRLGSKGSTERFSCFPWYELDPKLSCETDENPGSICTRVWWESDRILPLKPLERVKRASGSTSSSGTRPTTFTECARVEIVAAGITKRNGARAQRRPSHVERSLLVSAMESRLYLLASGASWNVFPS